jgi:UDPglucose 6-dehydrogenase
VAKAMGRDGRIGSKFLHPGPGYGGSCFPKDTRALAKIGRDYGAPLALIETAMKTNERQKERMVDKIEEAMGGAGSLADKTIAVLGLAYKPNTDDMREAPSIRICELLVQRGAALRVWDPAAMKEAVWRLKSIGGAVFFAEDEYDTLKGAAALVLMTEWNQFRNLNLARVKSQLTLPCFFDLRNVYKRDEVEEAGLIYFGVGK